MFGLAPMTLRAPDIRVNPIVLLMVLTAAVTVVLARDPDFERARLWRPEGLRPVLAGILRVFAASAAALVAAILVFEPGALFGFVRTRPALFALAPVLRPLLSVHPQELIYRVFFHHRYGALLPPKIALPLASAVSFALAHVIFRSWLAIVLSFAGGLLFARTHQRTRSTFVVSFEHALYGCLVFTVGLGRRFYHGAVH